MRHKVTVEGARPSSCWNPDEVVAGNIPGTIAYAPGTGFTLGRSWRMPVASCSCGSSCSGSVAGVRDFVAEHGGNPDAFDYGGSDEDRDAYFAGEGPIVEAYPGHHRVRA